MKTYEVVSWWADAVRQQAVTCRCGMIVDFLSYLDAATPKGIKDLADAGVAALQNNLVPGVDDAITLWQLTQCLKKFRYGCAVSPEEMQAAWLSRNAALEDLRLPWWLRDDMRELLAPLAEPFCAEVANGRFGNGAVFERSLKSVHARWLSSHRFAYNVRDPDDIASWRASSCVVTKLSVFRRIC
jgi:hypothetical protein